MKQVPYWVELIPALSIRCWKSVERLILMNLKTLIMHRQPSGVTLKLLN